MLHLTQLVGFASQASRSTSTYSLVASAGSYALTGAAAFAQKASTPNKMLNAPGGAYSLTGTAAGMVVAAAAPPPPLDAVASVTGAWSFSRNMLTSFGAGTRYTKTGTTINTLLDQSGNSRTFTSSGGSPTEVTAFPANVISASFNGSNNSMINATLSNFITATSGAMVASVIVTAASLNGTAYGNHGIMAEGGGYAGLFAKAVSTLTLYSYNYDGTEDVAGAVSTIGTAYVLMWRHQGGNLYFSVNGGTEVSVASGSTASLGGSLYLGYGSANYATMKLAEAFTTSDGSQTTALAAAIANMKAYVGA